MHYSNHFCKLRAELQAYAKTTFKLAPSGKRGSLGLEWLEGLLYQTPGTFSQHTVLEALIVTGGSPPYFGEQYRDLLLNLYRKLDENNSSSNQQVHNTVQQYIQTVVHDGIKSCGIKFCTSPVRHQGEELHGETNGRRNRRRNIYASLEV